MFLILTGTHTMVVKVPITPLEEVSYVPYIDRNSYYGGESASITPLEEVSYLLHIDRNSYYGGESASYSTGRGKLCSLY